MYGEYAEKIERYAVVYHLMDIVRAIVAITLHVQRKVIAIEKAYGEILSG